MNKTSIFAVACVAALSAPSLALAGNSCGDKQFAVTVDVNAPMVLYVSSPSNPAEMNHLYFNASETYCFTNGQQVTFAYPDLTNLPDLFKNGSDLFDSDSWNTSVTYSVKEDMHVVTTQDGFQAKLTCTTGSAAAC